MIAISFLGSIGAPSQRFGYPRTQNFGVFGIPSAGDTQNAKSELIKIFELP